MRNALARIASTIGLGIVLLCTSSRAIADVSEDELEKCATAAERAQNQRKAGQLTGAREQLLVCTRPVCPEAVKRDCLAWLVEVERTLPSIVVRAVDEKGQDVSDVRVSMDGKAIADKLDGRAIPIDPGNHTFECRTPGSEPVTAKVLVREGETNRVLEIRFARKEASAPLASGGTESPGDGADGGGKRIPTASWILGGAGIAAVATGAIFWSSGSGDHSDMESTCAKTQTCAPSDVDSAKRKLLIGDVAFGVGLVAIGAAVVLAVIAPDRTRTAARSPPARVDVQPTRGGAAVLLRTSF